MAITQQKQTIKPKSPKIDSKLSKKRDRKEYYSQRYQAKKQEWHQWYLQRKIQQEKQEKENQNKLYQANSIKVLLSLKEYTELNQEKHQKWLDFAWTFQEIEKTGFYDIVQIQKLEQIADKLIRDYYQTAQEKVKSSWNTLSEEQQNKLIKYWGREKARKEQEIAEKLNQQEQIGEAYEKDIELAKFHEERGKIKCSCYSCAKSKEIQAEIKEKVLNESEKQKEQCPECKWWVKELDGENGICKKCVKKYE